MKKILIAIVLSAFTALIAEEMPAKPETAGNAERPSANANERAKENAEKRRERKQLHRKEREERRAEAQAKREERRKQNRGKQAN